MADEPRPPVSIADARERTINSLSVHFANDALTLEELERRIELTYRAKDLTELTAITADLDAAIRAPVVPAANVDRGAASAAADRPMPVARRVAHDALVPVRDQVTVILSDSSRRGVWPVPELLDVKAILASTTIDFTQSSLPPVVEVNIRAVMSSVKLILPGGVHVVNHMGAFLSSMETKLPQALHLASTAPVIRLTGNAVMSSVEIVLV